MNLHQADIKTDIQKQIKKPSIHLMVFIFMPELDILRRIAGFL